MLLFCVESLRELLGLKKNTHTQRIVDVLVTLIVKDRQSWSDMEHAISMLIHALKI